MMGWARKFLKQHGTDLLMADWFFHVHLPKPLDNALYRGAEITLGWGPDAADWNEHKSRFLIWFYNWLWRGTCASCDGSGRLFELSRRLPNGTYHTERNAQCIFCGGTGKGFVAQ